MHRLPYTYTSTFLTARVLCHSRRHRPVLSPVCCPIGITKNTSQTYDMFGTPEQQYRGVEPLFLTQCLEMFQRQGCQGCTH